MPRSQDPRDKLPSQRGAKRTGAIGTILPGDDVEVARDIQRLWLEINLLRRSGSPRSGETDNRPTQALRIGTPFFDTTLGKPIWWDGVNWKTAAGATV